MRIQHRPSLTDRLAPRETTRALPWAALAVGAGVWTAPRVGLGIWPLWLVMAAGLLLLAHRALGTPARAAGWLVLFAAALFGTQLALHPRVPPEGAYATMNATVFGNPMPRVDGRVAVVLCDVSLDGEPQPGKAYLTLYETDGVTADQLFDGASMSFAGSVYHPAGKQNAFDFDFRMWLLQNGIGFGITAARDVRLEGVPETAPWKDVPTRLRNLFAQHLQKYMGAESKLAMAMLLGERGGLAEDEQLAFQAAGVAHLMSVSGLHVALLSGALSALLGALCLRKSIRVPVTAAFVVLYCVITGYSPAAVRATVMILLTLLAKATGRKPDPLTLLAAAAILVLAINPLDLFSAGFVLSFAAMMGVLTLYPRLRVLLQRKAEMPDKGPRRADKSLLTKGMRKGGDLLAISLSAQLGVLLPTAAVFHRLPLYGILFNLLAVPLAGLLVPLYAGVLLVSFIPWVGDFLGVALGFVAQQGSRLLLALVAWTESLPLAQVRVPSPGIWSYAGFLAIVAAVSGYVRVGWGRRLMAVALAGLLAVGGGALARPASLRYHQLAVGQGDASLLIDGDVTVAIDVGAYGSEVTQRLLAENRNLTALVLTHLHADHARGVAAILREGIAIGCVYLPIGAETTPPWAEGGDTLALLRANGVPVKTLAAGDVLAFHQASLTVLWPQVGGMREGTSANDSSLVTLIRLGRLRILNMADVSAGYDRYAATACDVLKVAHHGSTTATGTAFLETAQPQLALITCREGAALPTTDTLSKLAAAGATVLRTDDTGEMILEARAEQYVVSTYKARESDEP